MTTHRTAGPTPVARPGLSKLVWVTWRQHRTALLGMLSVMGLGALVLLLDGRSMHSAFTSSGMINCLPGHEAGYCGAALDAFRPAQDRVSQLTGLCLALPVLYGLFLGAPLLAREYESGTYRFAFTQGAGRVRWLIAKIVLLSSFTIATTTAFTAVVMWWYSPLVPLTGRLGNTIFESYGAVFVARALFAFAVGIAVGALLRRTVPAIGVTLGVWLVVVISTTVSLRQNFLTPLNTLNGTVPSTAWTVSSQWTGPDGHALTGNQVADLQYRAAEGGHKLDLGQYLADQGYRHLASYHPESRFWSFQAIEAGGLAAVSVALLILAIWLVRRRAA
ncbi:ABC transporter permease [Dactylosporangium siamense]|nr:ABC transporter permease subunit [Dactylosporangium siamense]